MPPDEPPFLAEAPVDDIHRSSAAEPEAWLEFPWPEFAFANAPEAVALSLVVLEPKWVLVFLVLEGEASIPELAFPLSVSTHIHQS
ncbi:hypothetical protein D3C87_1915080 [compost metagenome]